MLFLMEFRGAYQHEGNKKFLLLDKRKEQCILI